MCSPGINGEGELRGQPANPGSPGKMAVKSECVSVGDSKCIQPVENPTLVIPKGSHYSVGDVHHCSGPPSPK